MEQLSVLSLQSIAQLQAVAGRATPSGDEIQELRMKLYELEKSSCRDALTGVYKRDYFEGRLTQRLRQSDGQPVTLGILFGDVDKFKRINDTCGHAAGDAVLIAVATVLQSCVRNTDVVARYGGDEFVILAESPDPTFLEKLAERIHQQLASTTVRAGTEEIRVAMSLGGAFISIVPNERQLAQPLRLVALADEAMYECKRRGGNAVTIKVHAADVQRPAASA
jgi:diguanylate cyclase (GGDEF)-like protein